MHDVQYRNGIVSHNLYSNILVRRSTNFGLFKLSNKEDGSHAETIPTFASNKKLNQFLLMIS